MVHAHFLMLLNHGDTVGNGVVHLLLTDTLTLTMTIVKVIKSHKAGAHGTTDSFPIGFVVTTQQIMSCSITNNKAHLKIQVDITKTRRIVEVTLMGDLVTYL